MNYINPKAIKRAEISMACLGFTTNFYKSAQMHGLSAEDVLRSRRKYIKIFCSSTLKKSNEIEAEFIWLITLGILRREVDGQGLTSKVRLTPLGRKIVENRADLDNNRPGLITISKHWLCRKINLK